MRGAGGAPVGRKRARAISARPARPVGASPRLPSLVPRGVAFKMATAAVPIVRLAGRRDGPRADAPWEECAR